jgi:hypothetical protein
MEDFGSWGGINLKNLNIMNLKKAQKLTKSVIVALSVCIFTYVALPVQGETLTGLTYIGGGAGTLFTINSSSPGSILNSVGITGSGGGEVFVGIDYLGSVLYGVSDAGKLYTINPSTGIASLVGAFGTLNGLYFGMDASAAGIRIVSDADVNLLVNSSTGALISSTPTLTPTTLTIDAIASQGSTMYAVDSVANTLNILNTATGTITPVGAMGYDVSGKNGFDISSVSGVAYFASGVSSSALDANLYTLNLSTGIASLVGEIGPGEGLLVYGLTAPVPEPSIVELFFAGGSGLGLLALARRRR